MNRYQDFYNQQRERKGPSNQQNRRSIFNNVRKERRTRMFDLFRGDIAGYQPEEIKPIPKFTFRDTINKLIREKRAKVSQKPRPFVVGTVKHKIHSPPFLHEGCRSKEPKRKLITPVQKSFAPSNYKFKIPKGLAVNLDTPLGEENPVVSTFALNTVWNKLDNKSTRRKELLHNITHREKKRTCVDPSPNDALSAASGKAEQKGAKRELWPEAFDEGPIFGRLNMERRSRSLNSQPEENEKEASDLSQGKISNSVLPNSSFNSSSEKESDGVNIQNLKFKVDENVEPNIASMSTESLQNPVANTSRMSRVHESEMSTPSKETAQISNTVFNFDDPKALIEKDDANLEDIDLPCSTPSVQNFFKDIQVQFEKSSDVSIISTPSGVQDVVKECLPGYKDARIEAATPTSSPVEESPTVHNNSRIESERTLSDIESLENRQKILNLTFTKSLGLIEEDEGDEEEEETVKLNIEYLNKKHKKEDNMNSSPVVSILNSSNVNKANGESENLHKGECDTVSFDNTPKSNNTSLVIENDKNSKEIPSLSNSNVQDNCVDQTINAIQNNVVSPQKSPEKVNEVITNTSPELIHNSTKLDQDESLENSSKAPVKIVPKLMIELNSSKQIDADQSQTQETEQLIDNSNSTFSNSLRPSSDQLAKVNHAEIESNSKDSCGPCNMSSISTSTRRITEIKDVNSDAETYSSPILFEDQITDVNQAKPVSGDNNKDSSEPCDLLSVCTSERGVTENKDVNSDAETYNSPILFEEQSTEVNHVKPVSGDNNEGSNEPCNLLSVCTSERSVTENKDVNSDTETYNSPILFEDQSSEVSHGKPASGDIDKDNSESCNLSSVDISKRRFTENENVNSDVERDNDHSQEKEHVQVVATTNSTSSNCPVLLEDQPTEVIHAKSTSGNNNENCNDSQTSSSINTSNRRISEEKNTSLGRIVYSCPTKLIENIESTAQFITSLDPPEVNIATSSQVEKKTDLAAQRSPNSTGAEKIVSNETSKPRDTLAVSKIKIKISPSKLKNPVVQVDTDTENAHAGPVQSHNSVSNQPIIDLTDSPISANRKSTKLELRKSALDYKPSPLLLLNQKHNPLLSGSDENAVIDLVSDDEDDHTSYLSNLLKKYGMNSDSPKQSPRNRTPLASIENSLRLSTSRTPRSPLVDKVNSPAKKTPIIIVETIPRLSASRIPGSPLAVKINSPVKKSPVFIVKTMPILHISPPPAAPSEVLQDTPRKTPRRRKALKDITTEASEVPSPLRVMNLRTRNISVSPSPQKRTPRAVTPRKTPVKYDTVKEVAAEATEDTSHLRVMNLRSRKVNVSPSPKKMTPRRRKNDNQCA